jgi:beta-galactosidase
VGKGVAVFCRVDPDCFHADEKTYFRYTRWRATRAVAQLLGNLGASFGVDGRIFRPLDAWTGNPVYSVGPNGDQSGPQATIPKGASELKLSLKPGPPQSPSYYHPDYRTDFPLGDNPYRYYRW